MAAFAALVSLMNDLELIPNHPTHSFSFDKKQITSLSQTVHFLVDFMESYDSHGCTTEAAQVLESRIASAAHAAHEVIESHVVDQIHAGSTIDGKATSYFLPDLQKEIDDMDFVKIEAMQFQEKSGLKTELPTYSPPTSSQPSKNLMVGFDAVSLRLMEMLTGEPSSGRVIPIAGMGGMGKTTLARNVYGHLLIEHHFDVRLWATISQDYSLEDILTELVFGERKSTTGGDVNRLGEELHKMLWRRRYLIVLDDMWSVEAWDELHMFLPDNGNGSCVIVTTRLSNLAAHLSSSPFEMNFLDDDKSWELFCGKTFGEEGCRDELEEIGKRIVKRCRGLPLSIVVIGGHLRRSSRAIGYWEKVANFMNPISSIGEDEQCLNIISMSYEHLPACLKPCFLYMGMFEEDERIDAFQLLRLWISEGFVKAKEGVCLEEVAEDYLKDLIDRNLILVVRRKWNGKVEYCGIHDTVRELCVKVGKKEKFLCVQDTAQGIDIQSERRIAIMKGEKLNSDMIDAVESAPLVRSLLSQGCRIPDDVNNTRGAAPFSYMPRLLRVRSIYSYARISDDQFQQVNLRYLAFYVLSVQSLSTCFIPSSISLLWNLQTLVVMGFGVQFSAPCEIWEMPQLRHLEFIGVCHLPHPVISESSNQQEWIVLRNLHTLKGVEYLRSTEEVCQRTPNLKKLYVHFFGDYKESSYHCPHDFGRFDKLVSLECHFGNGSKWRDVVLSFKFPTSLEELSLRNCHLHWEDLRMMIKSLSRLGSLQLDLVHGSEWDLVDEEFPCLKELTISGCKDLIYWNANSSHFPVLEILHISQAPNLQEIPFDIGEIPTLRFIHLNFCSMFAAFSAMKIVVEQENLENQDLRLDVRFFEMEEVEKFQEMVQEEGLTTSSLHLFCMYEKIKAF